MQFGMAASEGSWTEILSAPESRVSTSVNVSAHRSPRDYRAFTASMKHPTIALVNVIAWAWLAVSIAHWLERGFTVFSASVWNAMGF